MGPVAVTTQRFASSDGTMLEADVLTPETPVANAVVCHPSPLHGGMRNDGVVAAMCRALVDANHQVIRFDFRGAGGADGCHDGGLGERDDLLAAIDQLSEPSLPLVLAGYSFGADIALSVAPEALRQWLVVAPVLQVFDSFAAASDERSTRMIAGAHDQFQPAENLVAIANGWVNAQVTTIESADHFFRASLGKISELTADLLIG
jgi:alpha/beta superfamily hydrolase